MLRKPHSLGNRRTRGQSKTRVYRLLFASVISPKGARRSADAPPEIKRQPQSRPPPKPSTLHNARVRRLPAASGTGARPRQSRSPDRARISISGVITNRHKDPTARLRRPLACRALALPAARSPRRAAGFAAECLPSDCIGPPRATARSNNRRNVVCGVSCNRYTPVPRIKKSARRRDGLFLHSRGLNRTRRLRAAGVFLLPERSTDLSGGAALFDWRQSLPGPQISFPQLLGFSRSAPKVHVRRADVQGCSVHPLASIEDFKIVPQNAVKQIGINIFDAPESANHCL